MTLYCREVLLRNDHTMNKHFFSVGALLALSVPGVPPVVNTAVPPMPPGVPGVVVPNGEELEIDAMRIGDVQVQRDGQGGTRVQVGDIKVNTSPAGTSVRAGKVRIESERNEGSIDMGEMQMQADEQGHTTVRWGQGEEDDEEVVIGGIRFGVERFARPAFSLDDLERSIEDRKQEFEEEFASSTLQNKDIVEGVNQTRLAVHALLASKNLLGNVGEQVSQIARAVSDSVATTTAAENKIQSRGFFANLLFGGDSTAADTIAQEVTQNQQRVEDLTKLLDGASVPTDIRATLTEQIAALKETQTLLQERAKKEQKRWGIFSWRF